MSFGEIMSIFIPLRMALISFNFPGLPVAARSLDTIVNP
jgi:hypothetical protein